MPYPICTRYRYVATAVTPTCDYCCCFAATAAARCWWCRVLVLLYYITAAAAAPAAEYCWVLLLFEEERTRYYCVWEAHTVIFLASPHFGPCDFYEHTPTMGCTGRIFDCILLTSEGKSCIKNFLVLNLYVIWSPAQPTAVWGTTRLLARSWLHSTSLLLFPLDLKLLSLAHRQ